MTIQELIALGKWEQFYLDKKSGEKFPFTEENTKSYIDGSKKDWSAVYQQITCAAKIM